jgi:hypothetical protein
VGVPEHVPDPQVGVAVKVFVADVAIEYVLGLIATELRGAAVTVITVDASCVLASRVAFTKRPTVPPVVRAVKVSEVPLPLMDPSVVFERDQV